MQGRLSPPVNERIQAFPADHWREEFETARALGLGSIEWTLDLDGIDANPFMTAAGQHEIRELSTRTGVSVPSLTGDCFMQGPFWKTTGAERQALTDVLRRVADACSRNGTRYVVVPLVDNGRIENEGQGAAFLGGITALGDALRRARVIVVIESDFPPAELRDFIARFPADLVGVNYDTGNSASLGFDTTEEIEFLGNRILNVHIKDRVRGGTTVPLGTGAAQLPVSVRQLEAGGYQGSYILQTARATDGDHAGAIQRYRDMLAGWMEAARGS